MNFATSTLLLALAFMQQPTIANASASLVVPSAWNVIERTCSDGAPATDGVRPGSMLLQISESNWMGGRHSAQLMIAANGELTIAAGSIGDGRLHLEKAKGRFETVPYSLLTDELMLIQTSGFGEGGSCLPGATLSTLLRRI